MSPPSITPPPPDLRRFLVCTDFSVPGNAAVTLCFALARPGTVVRLIHVVHPLALLAGEFARSMHQPQFEHEHTRVLAQSLEKLHALHVLVPPECVELGLTTQTAIVQHENPALGICAEAERFQAGLICLGSHGITGLKATLLGSVAQGVLKHARVPVLFARLPE